MPLTYEQVVDHAHYEGFRTVVQPNQFWPGTWRVSLIGRTWAGAQRAQTFTVSDDAAPQDVERSTLFAGARLTIDLEDQLADALGSPRNHERTALNAQERIWLHRNGYRSLSEA